ncbi:MAG TPA: 3-phosphoshikimate 1-carboxyvinyltransferase [Terriglobales bacterium]|nr:3-phosphoshikimate 1-carboxyvinyltransferase [Terriglobales bacterium]
MKTDSTVVVRPARGVAGTLRPPGDKSISHRYALLAAIAQGTTYLENFSTGADCASTLGCLQVLGVDVQRKGNAVVVHGRGARLQAPDLPLDCGNSGSTMRMLSGILAGQEFTSELIGDESLSRRPMSRIIAPLEMMGAKITPQEGGRPPLRVTGAELKAISYISPVASAQVKSCLLFAGLFAEGETSVVEPVRTRDHGELALLAFGAEVRQSGNESRVKGRQTLQAIEADIPGDISSAAFFLCAAALFPGSQLILEGLLMNPTRARLLDILTLLGVGISVTQLEEQHGELKGTVKAEGRRLGTVKITGADTAALIDEIPVLAAIAPYTAGGVEIRDARELRVKESDRIAAIATNLRAMGAEVDEREDGLKIPGGQKLHGAEVASLGDHRSAMAFAVAALRAEGETQIRGADAAVISYPGFFGVLESVLQR